MVDDISVLLTESRDSPVARAIKARLRAEAIERDLWQNPHVYLVGMIDVSGMPGVKEPELTSTQRLNMIELTLTWLDVAPLPKAEPMLLALNEIPTPYGFNATYERPQRPTPDHRMTEYGWARTMQCGHGVNVRTFLDYPDETARRVGHMLAHCATRSVDWVKFRKRGDVYDDRFDEGGYPRESNR
jgi:hypothetical protein